jgi:DivIVA domain-containing protein
MCGTRSATLARTLQLNRESIERRDFPLARRGYDPAAVDAHLQALAAAVAELVQRAAAGAGEPSLSSAAATRVQGILEAAQTTAAEIAREAQRDAQRSREDVALEVERAHAHVETLAQVSAALLARVQALDGEVSALAQSLRTGGEAPAAAAPPAVEGMPVVAESRDGGDAPVTALAGDPASPAAFASVSAPAPSDAPPQVPASTVDQWRDLTPSVPVAAAPASSVSAPDPAVSAPPPRASGHGAEDLDGARLVALNMALGGESREQTDRYLAESFQLTDRAKLLDEVYAAVEG